MAGRILVADDEMGIVSFVKDYFELEGYEVMTASNGSEVVEKVGQNPDIILLDIMMPEIDGIEVCRIIRERVSCPIIFLTARIEEADKIMGLGAGADDYVVKPFSIVELGARVNAHLRREKRRMQPSKRRWFGQLSIDFGEHTIHYAHNEISLARKEYEIVELLSLNAGQVFSRERIYERIWGYDADGDDSAVTEHVKRIRSKLAQHTDRAFIDTVWGVGYKWLKD